MKQKLRLFALAATLGLTAQVQAHNIWIEPDADKEASGPVATTQGVLYGLHLGRFADIETRWLYFVVGLLGTAMVGSGLVLWTVKRRSKLANPDKPYFGFRLVERLNIATIAGLSIAMVAFLWLNRWLPVAMEKRAEWEIHGFFIVWLASLIWALARSAPVSQEA